MRIRISISGKKHREWHFDTDQIKSDDLRRLGGEVRNILGQAAQRIRAVVDELEASQVRPPGDDITWEPVEHQPPAPTTRKARPGRLECRDALAGTELAERSIDTMPVRGATAALIPLLDTDQDVELWQTTRDLVVPHGCYPVFVMEEMLDFAPWEAAPDDHNSSADRFSALREALFAANPNQPHLPIVESFTYRETVSRFGRGPTEAELAAVEFATDEDVDAFLFDWERREFGDEAVIAQASQRETFAFGLEPDNMKLMILPVPDGASAVELLGFYPVDNRPEWLRPLGNDLRCWAEDFGAELIADYGTMLEFVVTRPPTDLDTAYRLAIEHNTAGNATLAPAGISPRHYAADLVGLTRWHLHDRP